MQRKVSNHGSDVVYSAVDIFMRKAHNSQLENAGYTRKLPEVGDPTNDPHGEITDTCKDHDKEGLCAQWGEDDETNKDCANIKQAFRTQELYMKKSQVPGELWALSTDQSWHVRGVLHQPEHSCWQNVELHVWSWKSMCAVNATSFPEP